MNFPFSEQLNGTSLSALAGIPFLRLVSLEENQVDYVPTLIAATQVRTACHTPPWTSSSVSSHLACVLLALPYDTKTLDEGEAMQPFPHLEILSLGSNLIAMPEDILPVQSFPMLRELHLWDNPIARVSAKLPPEVQESLVDDCGIDVFRRRPKGMERPPVFIDPEDFIRVDTTLPPPLKLGGGLREHLLALETRCA